MIDLKNKRRWRLWTVVFHLCSGRLPAGAVETMEFVLDCWPAGRRSEEEMKD